MTARLYLGNRAHNGHSSSNVAAASSLRSTGHLAHKARRRTSHAQGLGKTPPSKGLDIVERCRTALSRTDCSGHVVRYADVAVANLSQNDTTPFFAGSSLLTLLHAISIRGGNVVTSEPWWIKTHHRSSTGALVPTFPLHYCHHRLLYDSKLKSTAVVVVANNMAR